MDIKTLFTTALLGASVSTMAFAEQVALPEPVTVSTQAQQQSFFKASKQVQEQLMAEEARSDVESQAVKKNYENYISALAGLEHANHRYINREFYQQKATMKVLVANIEEVKEQLAFIDKTMQVKGSLPSLVEEQNKKLAELKGYQKHLDSVEKILSSNPIESK